MSNKKGALLLALLAVAVMTATISAAAAQRRTVAPRAAAPPQLPAISQTCPMHPDVVESAPGSCPICKMQLVPVRLESVWTCPLHPVIAEGKADTCPLCSRPLVQMTMALTWTCAGHPEVDRIDRGVCADGSAMMARRTLRPHGNHNPQHGGQFFMAPDNTHHLEGALPAERVFRLYLYDDFARPLPPARLKAVRARVVTKETYSPSTRTTKELAVFPLTAAREGGYLEARVDRAQLPAQMSAKVRFKPGEPEYRFDFAFPALSRDPASPLPRPTPVARNRATAARTSAAASTVPPPPRPAAQPAPPAPSTAPDPAVEASADPLFEADPSLVAQPIPDNVPEILASLQTRRSQVADLIERGNFTAVYVPAFQAKDLAIALEGRLGEVSTAQRERAEPAIQALVREAWLLDSVGDLGNREQIVAAFGAFSASVDAVVAACSAAP